MCPPGTPCRDVCPHTSCPQTGMLCHNMRIPETINPTLRRCLRRHKQDLQEASKTPRWEEEFGGTKGIPLLPAPSSDWAGRCSSSWWGQNPGFQSQAWPSPWSCPFRRLPFRDTGVCPPAPQGSRWHARRKREWPSWSTVTATAGRSATNTQLRVVVPASWILRGRT